MTSEAKRKVVGVTVRDLPTSVIFGPEVRTCYEFILRFPLLSSRLFLLALTLHLVAGAVSHEGN